MYYLKIIVLKNCGYCNDAIQLLKEYKKIEIDIITIKDDERHLYKTEFIKTFPQIYLKKKNSIGSLLIGGYDDLNFIKNTIKKNKNTIEKIKKKYKNFSRKAVLRLIELFIN
jgi:glutaredoxin-related protein